MPTPKELSGGMFAGLEGPKFLRAVDAFNQLVNAKKTYISNHDQNLSLEDGFGLGNKELLAFSQALLVRGHAFHNFITYTTETGIIPFSWEELGQQRVLNNVFDTKISFEREHQVITVSRGANREHSVMFQHDGLANPFIPSVRFSIAGLAIVPDSYWPEIAKHGLVVGNVRGDYYDNPLHIDAYSIMLPDPNGILHYSKFPGLKSFSIGELINIKYRELNSRSKDKPITNYLRFLKPVAILGDERTITPV